MKRTLAVTLLALAGAAAAYVMVSAPTDQHARETADLIESFDKEGLAVATFAGGCFWCVEAALQEAPGVREAFSGYSGGDFDKPTYKLVANGLTNHTESVQVYYDPEKITYEGLLQVLWRTADPTDTAGQFADRGRQYRPAIFYHNEEQRLTAVRSRDELAKNGPFDKPIKIEISPFKGFYVAENYHQDYYKKNPLRYRFYTVGSGRAGFQLETWGDDLEVDFSKYKPSKKPGVAPLANAI